MDIISSIIAREQMRNENLTAIYLKELECLPKGSIKTKCVNGNNYYYLNYRDGKKIISKYIGKDEQSLREINEKLERRKQIESIIKKLKDELIQIKKVEAKL